MVWGWVIVAVFTMCVALAMAGMKKEKGKLKDLVINMVN